nr:MAG TPA: hypothetical protein [Bacteriophage sp.]DAH33219.1 MAG TPA: hypothetical protein [Caudoviricetes sp.]
MHRLPREVAADRRQMAVERIEVWKQEFLRLELPSAME